MSEDAKRTEQKLPAGDGATPVVRELTEEEFRFRETDPYVQALTLAIGHTTMLSPRPDTFYAAELGVYRGRSLAIMLDASAKFAFPIKWLGFDTFEGLPPLSSKDIELAPPQAAYLKRPMYNDTTIREVLAYLEPLDCSDRFDLIPGRLSETLNAQPERQYLFVNISIKTYEAHMLALNYFYPRMLKGGVILFDDFFNRGTFPMAEAAIREFLSDKNEPLYWIFCGETHSNFRRALIVKS